LRPKHPKIDSVIGAADMASNVLAAFL
jgi:hypothetical protein